MQLSYDSYMAAGIAGTLYDLSDSQIDGFAADTAMIPGIGVVNGATLGKTIKLPSGAVTGFRGVTMLRAHEQDMGGNLQYDAKESIPVISRGRVWVYVTGAVNYDDDVYLVHTGTDAGKFINATGANQGQITNAKFRTSTAGAGIAVVELK